MNGPASIPAHPGVNPAPRLRPGRATAVAALASLAAALLTALFPADAQFVHDEAVSVRLALLASYEGRLADLGLVGSVGIAYGPLPTQLLQLLIWVGDDVPTTLAIRAALFSTATAAGLLFLGRGLRLGLWFVPLALISPPVWYQARLLWDNSWIMPLGIGLLAGYVHLIRSERRLAAIAMSACGIAMPLVHPMSAALGLIVAGHALLFHRRVVRKRLAAILVTAVVAAAPGYSYIAQTLGILVGRGEPVVADEAYRGQPPTLLGRSKAAAWAWAGPLLWTTHHHYARIDPAGPAGRVLAVLGPVSWMAYGFFVAGIALSLAGARAGVGALPAALGRIAIASLVLQSAVFIWSRPHLLPHYLLGGAPATAVLCWLGADAALRRFRWTAGALWAWGAALAVATVLVAWSLHRSQGTRYLYGPNIRQMQAVAAEARERGVVGLWTNVRHLVDYPYGLSVLVEWPSLRGRPVPRVTGAIGVVEFASEDRYDARLTLRVLDPETGPPKRYFRVWPEVQKDAGTN